MSAFTAYVGYLAMFSQFVSYDDEGDWLIGIKYYHSHGSLYHDTYSQCGPFYYEFWSAVYSVTGLRIDLDTARSLTLAIWVVTSLLIGVSLLLMTGRLVLALIGQVTTFILLISLINEPMDPGGLACFLVAVGFLCLPLARRYTRSAMTVAGATIAAVVLTKVNVGLFLLASVLFAMVVAWPNQRFQWSRQTAAVIGMMTVPTVLMGGLFNEYWVRSYYEIEILSIAAFAVTVAALTLRRPPMIDIPLCGYAWCLGAGVAFAALIASFVLANGTSVSELLNGAILSQRNLSHIFVGSLNSSPGEVLWAIGALSVALGNFVYRSSMRERRVPVHLPPRVTGTLRIAVGTVMCISLLSGLVLPNLLDLSVSSRVFTLALPLAWVGLLQPRRDPLGPRLTFVRCAICATGVLLTLEAFPVAGSQESWAGLGLVVVSVLIIRDGLVVWGAHARRERLSAEGSPWWTELSVSAPALVLAVVLLGGSLNGTTAEYSALYDGNVPSKLLGAGRLRLPMEQAAEFRAVTRSLQSHCTTFESLPGLNSFYFFTGMNPPTGLNTTQWMYLLSDAAQRRVVERLETIRSLCLLEDPQLLPFWQQGKALPAGSPLLQYMSHGFITFAKIGDFVLMRRGPV